MKPNGARAFCAGLLLVGCLLSVSTAWGNSPETAYTLAEAAYQKLQDAKGDASRETWINCIRRFENIYEQDPAGPWAAAGLFMSGKLYQELGIRSGLTSDQKEAEDHFKRILRRYPQSKYKSRAEQELQDGAKRTDGAPSSSDPKPVAKKTVAPEVREARKREAGADTGAPQKHRDPQFLKEAGPGTPSENGALTQASSGNDLDALTQTAAAPESSPANNGSSVTVTGLRYWSNPHYTRVAIYANRDAAFAHRLLKQDAATGKPPRLYVDLDNSRVGRALQSQVAINDDLLSNARAAQYSSDLVRVVVDIKSFESYKVYSLRDPFRIIIDVWGESSTTAPAPPPPSNTASNPPSNAPSNYTASVDAVHIPSSGKNMGTSALAKQLALGVRRIVIDPGHGGKDFGAPGQIKGVYEKDVTLAISKKLAAKIERELGCEVMLTRTTDKYLTLEERTAIANTKNADLFISVHTNAAKSSQASGIETYFLNLATDNDSILVAARENATSEKNISDLQSILNDLMRNIKVNESSRLAGHVQSAIVGGLSQKYGDINNKKVKQAPFYVLLGTRIPAVLVETSFISNPMECKRLTDNAYQDALASGILDGIRRYIRETNPTAGGASRSRG